MIQEAAPRFLSVRRAAILLLLSVCLFIPGLFSLPMDDRDSAHFAQATRQMVETGQYFQIRFQDITRFQKPPGINWLQALSVNAFSSAESNDVWPYRLPSAIGGLLSILLLFAIGRRHCGDRIAFIASVLLGSTLLLSMESHLIVIDAMLLVSVLLMQAGLWECYDAHREGRRAAWYWPALFWLAMSWGICLKGVTPLVGLLCLAMLMIWERDWRLLLAVRPLLGIPLLLVSSSWVLGVNQAENSNYLWQLFQKDLLPKLQGGHESHGMPTGYHFLLLPLTFWPASLFLWRGLVWAQRNCREHVEKFLISWIVPTWIFFELMPTKLPQYVLPTFPALALLCASAIAHKDKLTFGSKQQIVLRVLTALWWLLCVVLAGVLLYIPWYLLHHELIGSMLTAAGLLIFSTAAVWFAWREKLSRAVISTTLLALITFAGLFQGTLPNLTPVWTTERIATITRPLPVDAKHPLISIGYDEPSLVFVIGTHAVHYSSPKDSVDWLDQHGPSIVLIDKKSLADTTEALTSAGYTLSPVESFTNFNYSKGEWVELSIYRVG